MSIQENAGLILTAKTHISETASQVNALHMIISRVSCKTSIVLERTQQTLYTL